MIDVIGDVYVTVSKLRTRQEAYESFSSFVNTSILHRRVPEGLKQ